MSLSSEESVGDKIFSSEHKEINSINQITTSKQKLIKIFVSEHKEMNPAKEIIFSEHKEMNLNKPEITFNKHKEIKLSKGFEKELEKLQQEIVSSDVNKEMIEIPIDKEITDPIWDEWSSQFEFDETETDQTINLNNALRC